MKKMMGKIKGFLARKDVGAIGIGAMIVFIAMVLVAGIAASVLIQTSGRLESQAMTTGRDTIAEVSTGLAVVKIEGYAASVTANLSKMGIMVRPRAGSSDIDISTTYIELSDTNMKIILDYNSTGSNNWHSSTAGGINNTFSIDAFPDAANKFGIIVLEDADDSCSKANPVINRGDKVLLTVNTALSFSDNDGIINRASVWGSVVPEYGSPGIIGFKAPLLYNYEVMQLQ
jgi:archaeal flagellin FlaB